MNDFFLNKAFFYAEQALKINEVPVDAVIVKDNEIISYGYNMKELKKSVFYHAEIIAIRQAEKILGDWRLSDCELYVTLDPCPMCASAIKQSRIRCVYSALSNSDLNNVKIINEIFSADKTNPAISFYSNLCVDRSQKLLSSFFKEQR